MVTFDNGELPEAPDVPPENAFDVQSFATELIAGFQRAGVITERGEIPIHPTDAKVVEDVAWFVKEFGDVLASAIRLLLVTFQPLLEQLITTTGQVLDPGMDTLGALTQVYVNRFVREQSEITRGAPGEGPGGLRPAARGMFDSILAPLAGIAAAHNPKDVGAGEANAQFALGSITNLHLSTWAVNIISNLTGFGALKFINSFDDAMTAAISSRGISRIALKPYLAKFMGDPLTRDLNLALPLKQSYFSALVKRYIRGNMTAQEFKNALREQGYDDETAGDLLLDNLKLFSVDDLLWMIDQGLYTFDQAVDSLKQQGYAEEVARVKLRKPAGDLVAAQHRTLANSLVNAFIDHRLDNPTLRYLLEQAGFSPEEVNAMVTRGAILQELPTRLSRGDVVALFNEGLVDLGRVLEWLTEEGYNDDDADLLALLYFTRKEERDQRAAEIADRRRVAEEDRLRRQQEEIAQQQAELLLLS